MLIDEIVSKCDKRYSNLADCQCEDCPCETECSHDCKECLENVHFPDRTTIRREYDCVNMADCYYCKYAYGDEYKRNCLIFDDIPDEIRKAYNPFDSCASAQILIKKSRKK